MEKNRIIADRYRIIEPLGEGGMANVYHAYDLILQRDVSLKLLRVDLRDNPEVRRRFHNEIEATTELIHPNVIQVYDYGEENGLQYLVSEYVDGMDLKRYIAQRYPIPVTRVIDIMSEILSGVQAAHEHNIVHRDLKPQNILINTDGDVKITDFGIAQGELSNGMTKANSTIGSVHYISPEQVKGEPATTRSDIYALGIILFEMLAGHVPYDGETAVAIAVKHTSERLPYLRDEDPRLPQALENVIIRATAKNPRDRYVNVAEMRKDLATVMSPSRVDEERLVLPDEVDDGQTKVMPLPILPISSATAEEAIADKVDNASVANQPGEAKPKKKKMSRRKKILIVAGLIIVAILGLGIYGATAGAKETVPYVNGQTQKSAEKALQAAGFEVGKITKSPSTSVAEGKVISTNPKADAEVKKGSKINLIVSSGPASVRFGDYQNEKYTTVLAKLKAKGYSVTKKEKSSEDIPAGYIMSQSIDAESKVIPSETKVVFTVSTGAVKITVPDFSNKTQSEVETWAATNKISVSFNRTYSDNVPENQVIGQSVTAGTTITKSTSITFQISNGATPVSSSSKSSSTSSSSTSSSASSETSVVESH
jgi:serine/threonine-protein kinase